MATTGELFASVAQQVEGDGAFWEDYDSAPLYRNDPDEWAVYNAGCNSDSAILYLSSFGLTDAQVQNATSVRVSYRMFNGNNDDNEARCNIDLIAGGTVRNVWGSIGTPEGDITGYADVAPPSTSNNWVIRIIGLNADSVEPVYYAYWVSIEVTYTESASVPLSENSWRSILSLVPWCLVLPKADGCFSMPDAYHVSFVFRGLGGNDEGSYLAIALGAIV